MPSFHWSNMHAGHTYKGFAKYCAYKFRKVGANSRLRAVLLFARKSVTDCDIYVSIDISNSLTDFRAKEGLLEVQSTVSLYPAWGWRHKRISWGKISVRFPHSPIHLVCIRWYVWTLKDCMRLLHACKVNIWGKPKFYPLYRQSGAPYLEEYMRTTKAGGLNGLRNRVKDSFD